MPQIDIVDSTWIGVPARRVAQVVADPGNWARWWPRLCLELTHARGAKGMRWAVSAGEGGTVVGSMEVWLEPAGSGPCGGVVAHFFLRLDGASRPLSARRVRVLTRRYRVQAKRLFWGIGDALDPDRLGRVRPPARSVGAAPAVASGPVASSE